MDAAPLAPESWTQEDSDSSEAGPSVQAPRAWRKRALLGASALGLLLGACLLFRGGSGTSPAGPGSLALRGTVELEADHSEADHGGCNGTKCHERAAAPDRVSLYCFSQMVSYGPEEALVKQQFARKCSIFSCDDFDVTCHEKRLLGKGDDGTEFYTLINPSDGKASMGNVAAGATTSSFLNVLIFQKAWDVLIKHGKVWKHDWTVKVDPDCVFFPVVLRRQLKPHTSPDTPATFVMNCREPLSWTQPGAGGYQPTLYGAMEVYSKRAMGAYKDSKQKCLDGLQWQGWGEDLYMHVCMDGILGAKRLIDYELVGDKRCAGNTPSQCGEANRAGYHDYKDVNSYFACYDQGAHTLALEASGQAIQWGQCGGEGKPDLACPAGWHCFHKQQYWWQCQPN
uniref:Hexosyltransferase n=1 Tax=Alexandrium catenella TaxID=2925 RepID=A0A7S1LQG4_ALECA